jgi:hypothetical protein
MAATQSINSASITSQLICYARRHNLTKLPESEIRDRLAQVALKLRKGDREPAQPTKTPAKSRKPRTQSKQSLVIGLMKRPGGVTLDEICEATEWKKSSVRAFVAASLRTRLGLKIRASRVAGQRTYEVL